MNMSDVANRLTSRFGMGTRPDLRRSLYDRLEKLVHEEGEPAYVVIATVAADAAGKTNPGRYFAHVVMLRLQEKGFLPSPEI